MNVGGAYTVSTVSHCGNLTYQRRVEGMTQPPETVLFPPVCQLAAVWTGAPLTEPSLCSGHTLTSEMMGATGCQSSAADLHWHTHTHHRELVCVCVCVCVSPWEDQHTHTYTHTHTMKSPTQLVVGYPADSSCDWLVTDRSGSSSPVG